MSALGPKKGRQRKIENPIVITPGQGIVGTVFKTGVGEIVNDTSSDHRYIKDDAVRLSEITIPIIANGKVVGIIDAEHPDKFYFTTEDFKILTTIANLASIKLEWIQDSIDSEKRIGNSCS